MSLSAFNKTSLLNWYPSTIDISRQPNQNLAIAHLNIRSIKNKIDYIANSNLILFDMLIFTESFLKEDFPDSLLDIDGFKFIRKDRAGSKPGGGIIFYYKSNISVSVIEDKNLSEAESLWVEIFNQKSKSSIIISAIYRPPSGNIRLFTDSLIDTIDTFNRNSTIVCLGDFNINFLEDSYSSNLLKSAINHLEFSVLNKFPTRVTDNSESLIDLILTNKPDNFFNT